MFDLPSEQISPFTLSKGRDRSSGRPIRIHRAPEEQVLSFFLQFTIEERVVRFGAATSDDSIRSWRDGLDRSHYLVVGLEQGRRTDGLVELFGSRLTGWKRPELALSVHEQCDAHANRRYLLEIGLSVARERGARNVCIAFNPVETAIPAIARQYGATLDHETGTAIVPCGFEAGGGHWRGDDDCAYLAHPFRLSS